MRPAYSWQIDQTDEELLECALKRAFPPVRRDAEEFQRLLADLRRAEANSCPKKTPL